MALFLNEDQVATLLAGTDAMGEAIGVLERTFREMAEGRVTQQRRLHVDYPPGSGFVRSIRILPGIVPGLEAAAVRVYTTYREFDPDRRAPSELLLLYDYADMHLLAIIEDYVLHTLRTAAPTGVAVKYLARPDAREVGVIGSGRQARGQLRATAQMRSVTRVRVYSPKPERRELFATEMSRELQVPVIPVDTAAAATEDADIVLLATNAYQPVIQANWLAAGTHVNSIASGELPEEIVLRHPVIPCWTEEVVRGIPPWEPFHSLLARGSLRPEQLDVQLADVVAGKAAGRQDENQVTVFVSTGMGIWDAAIARWVYEAARARGLGVPLPMREQGLNPQ